MCGVAGAIRRILDGREAAARPRSQKICGFVERISEAQRHRGPDGAGLWESRGGEVVFAHRRLAILDLSEAAAPPRGPAGPRRGVAFDGEGSNFSAVRLAVGAG